MDTSLLQRSKLPSALSRRHQDRFDSVWRNAAWDQLPAEVHEQALQSLQLDYDGEATLIKLVSGPTLSLQPASASDVLAQVWPSSARSRTTSEGRKSAFEKRLIELGEPARRTLEYDWQNTPLGHLSMWSAALQVAAYTTLTSKHPSALWLGDTNEPLLLHNDVFAEQLSSMDLFGTGVKAGFGDQYAPLVALYERVRQSGKPVAGSDEIWIFPDKDGRLKEMMFNYEWLPLYDDDGSWLGCFNTAIEESEKIHARRDLEAIAAVTTATASARTIDGFCSTFAETVSSATPYFPFLLLYTTDEETSAQLELARTPRSRCLTRRGCYGVPEDHELAPTLVQLQAASHHSSSAGEDSSFMLSDHIVDAQDLPWRIAQVMHTGKSNVLEELGEAVKDFREIGKTDGAVVYPVKAHSGAIQGVLVLGLYTLRPFADSYANLASVLAQSVNIGLSRVALIEENEAHLARLQELERLKAIFFGTISDELQTPISLILAPLNEMIELPETTAHHKKSLRSASRNALHLLSLFGTLLDYFRSHSGDWTPIFRLVQLQIFTTEIMHQLLAVTRSSHSVKMVVDAADAVQIYTDPHIFEKLLLLVVGALVRTIARKRSLYTVTVSLKETEDGALLTVRRTTSHKDGDSAVNELDHSSVDQLHDDRSSFDRLGLARSLMLDFVRLLRGHLTERKDRGSATIEVSLPTRDRDTLLDERVIDEEQEIRSMQPKSVYAAVIVSEEGASTEGESDSSSGEQKVSRFSDIDATFGQTDATLRDSRVCIAEGNAEMRLFCRDALAYFSDIVEVRNAREATEVFESGARFDLIVTDAALPGMDAWSLIAALRERGLDVPVIVLSTRIGGEAKADSLMAGAAELLVKPFSARELLVKACSQIQITKLRGSLTRRLTDKTEALGRSEMRADDLDQELKAIANASPVGLFTLNVEGAVLYANAKFHEITGIAPANTSSWLTNVSSDDGREIEDNLHRLSQSATSYEGQISWLNGRDTLLGLQSWRMSDDTLRLVGSAVDVSELRRLERAEVTAVKERADEAERMRRVQETSVDVYSHELRNPLSSTLQAATLLSDELEQMAIEADNSLSLGKTSHDDHAVLLRHLITCDDMVSSIKSCALHQRRIADDILNFSKLNMKLLSLSLQAFDSLQLIRDTIKMFEPEMRRNGMSMALVQHDSLVQVNARYIVADPHRLGQVLVNFVTNAIRYSMAATDRRISIIVGASATLKDAQKSEMRVLPEEGLATIDRDSVWYKMAVQDQGRGLSPAEQQTLFERFAQARPTIDGLTGSGLGLFISKYIVHLHGGFVEVSSSSASTTFAFCIPVRRVTANDVAQLPALEDKLFSTALSRRQLSQEDVSIEKSLSDRATSPSSAPVSPMLELSSYKRSSGEKDLVLVVDDSPINVKLLERQLQKKRYDVTTAGNGQEALDSIERLRSRLLGVTMDVQMPVMDGLTAVAELRRRESQANLPRLLVIGVTGNARDEQKESCLSAGYDHVLTKPYSIDDIERLFETAHATS